MAMTTIESGRSGTAPAKVFFSICVAILLYPHPLSQFIDDDFQIILFWSGVALVILSVVPIVEWGLKLFIKIFDRRLPAGSASYWETITRSPWEPFLNNTIRDLYLTGALLLISGKIATNRSFFDQDIPGIPSDANWIVVLIGCIILVVVLVGTIYDRYLRQAGDLRLTQRYLTIMSKEQLHTDKQADFYINRTWELFRRISIPRIIEAYSAMKELTPQMREWITQGPSTVDDFASWADLIAENQRLINRTKPETIPPLAKLDPKQLGIDLQELIGILRVLPTLASAWWSIFKLKAPKALALLRPIPDWSVLTEQQNHQLQEATEHFRSQELKQGRKFEWDVNERWVKSIYERIEKIATRLEEFNNATKRYLQSLSQKSLPRKLGLKL